MTRRELNLINMFKAVEQFVTINLSTLEGFQPIVASHYRLKEHLAVIELLGITQGSNTIVQSKLKLKEKEQLNANLMKVSNALKAIAISNNDIALQTTSEIMKYSDQKLREADYEFLVQKIYRTALPHKEALMKWGVTDADVESLNTLSASLIKRTPGIRNMKVVSKQATAEIKEKVKAANDEIHNVLDGLMKPFATMNPTLYGQYRNARIIIELAASQKKADTNETK